MQWLSFTESSRIVNISPGFRESNEAQNNLRETSKAMSSPTTTELTHIAAKITQLRLQSGFTLEEISRRSGLSVGMLSQLERGIGNPTFSTLAKLAYTLQVPVGTFFELTPQQNPVVRKSQRKRLTMPNAGESDPAPVYELLTPDLQRKLEVLHVELPPGQSNADQPFLHDTEECGILLQGQLEVHIGEDVYLLEEGDSISFRGTQPHWYRNPGKIVAVSIWIVTPPSF